MKSFAYRAFTAEGVKRSGLIIAEDRADASRRLRKDGLFPEDISEQAAGEGLRLARRTRRLDADMQALFARQLAVLLAAELPVDEALSVVQSGSGTGPIDDVATRARALVLEGAPLSEALDKGVSGFAPYVISAIRAGEASRDLAAVFETIAAHLEERNADKAALATALIYPAFVAVVALIVCTVLMLTVAPQLAEMFEATGQPLPGITQVMLGMTAWIADNILLVFALPAAAIVGIVLLLRRPAMRALWHDVLLRLPVLGRLTRLEASHQYLRTLALVIGSRQPVIEGVRNATGVLTIQSFRDESDRVTAAIHAGAALSLALSQTSFLPVVAHQLVEAGEKSGRVALMTGRAAQLVETWLANDRKRIAALLDPLLMIVIGGFVLVVVLSVLLPIFDMQSALQF